MKKIILMSFVFTLLIGIGFAQTGDMSALVSNSDANNQVFQDSTEPLSPAQDDVAPVTFSPDGEILATLDEGGAITLKNVVSGQALWVRFDPLNDVVTSLAFSPDGKTLASAGKNAINLWVTGSGQERSSFPLGDVASAVVQISFSPDGKRVVGVKQNGDISLWNLKTGGHKSIQTNQGVSVDEVAFSPDGKLLAIALNGVNPKIKLWDVASGHLQTTLAIDSKATQILFSPNSEILAIVDQMGRISLRDSQSGAVKRIIATNEVITAIAFSPDSKTLVTGSAGDNPKIQSWNPITGALNFARQTEGGAAVTDLYYSPDGSLLASVGRDYRISLLSIISGELQQLLSGQNSLVTQAAFNSKQNALAAVGNDGQLIVWDLRTGLVRQSFQVPFLLNADLSNSQVPHSKFAATAASSQLTDPNLSSVAKGPVTNTGTSQVANLANLNSTKKRGAQKWKGIKALAISQDGTEMGTGSVDGTLRIFKRNNVQRWKISGHHGKSIAALAFRNKAKQWVSVGEDTEIKTWDDASGNILKTFYGPEHPPRAVVVSPDGQFIATAGEDTRIFLYDAIAQKLSKIFSGHANFVNGLAFSPDGKVLASAGAEGRILLWNIKTGEKLQTLLGHSSEVNAVAFSPDGTLIASASSDSSIILWDSTTGEQIKKLSGHQGGVKSVAFSPNGKKLVSSGDDSRMLVWDPKTGRLKKQMGGQKSVVNALCFDPAGNLHTADENNEVSEFNTETGIKTETLVVPPTTAVEPQSNNSDSFPLAFDSNKGDLALTANDKGESDSSSHSGGNVIISVANKLLDWIFPSANAAIPPPPGGPILVVTNGSPSFGDFYPELLRTEGLNEFAVANISNVSATTLSAYDVVVLAQIPLTQPQVDMFNVWVTAGGNLIAMRPDKKLAGLLGLTDAGTILDNGYFLVNTSASPGNGIVGETMQFHGTADRYSISGATSIATLYSNASTATSNPAVTLRSVGANGGQAAAFSYDLARSIIYTRQGNPAWATQDRDITIPNMVPLIRSNDKFYGDGPGDPQPDWIDFTKISIPQGDEQQRLLVNLILEMNKDKKPLPHFWYFPNGFKSAVIMTGDDHANNGTEGRFNSFITASPAGCTWQDWECVRGTSYMYHNTPIAPATAANFNSQGFEVGLHVNTNCGNFTPTTLEAFYVNQINLFQANFSGLPAPLTQRHHCIAWSDWVTGAKVQLNHGIRLDTSYYFWPPSWVDNRPGFFSGSGMPMRFADLDGSLIDVYNVTSQLTDESGQTYPFTIDSLLDKAVGTEGYYGAYTVNAHTDVPIITESTTVVASAQARGVPIVTSRQMMDWLDYRNSSSFSSVTWSANTLSFTVTPGTSSGPVPSNGLQVLLPLQSAGGVLTTLSRNGVPLSFSSTVIKGVGYAAFSSAGGNYTATYAVDTTPPTVTSRSPAVAATGVSMSAVITATFSEPVDPATVTSSTFELRNTSNAVIASTVSYSSSTRTATLTPSSSLAASTTYTATIKGGAVDPRVKDMAGIALAANVTWTFTTGSQPCASSSCSAWPNSTIPSIPSVNDPGPLELGVKFRSDLDGVVTGIRFYKGATNTGTHVGNLWSTSGTRLATATFSGETASGWQQVNFSSPVAITANTTYVASYYAPNGNYAATSSPEFSTQGVDNPPIHLLMNGIDGGNGVYAYSASSTFPVNTFNASNYWVDVLFSTNVGPDTTPPTVTAQSPSTGATGVPATEIISATFSEAMNASTITTASFELRGPAPGNTLVPAAISYNSTTRTATLAPSAALSASTTYSVTVKGGVTDPRVKDAAGNALATNFSWSFTTAAAGGTTGCSGGTNSIWPITTTPAVLADSDTTSVELGVKFRSTQNGFICGVRFYKASTNTGTHIGKLWNSTGTLLASANFQNETASGWQQVNFANPVQVVAGTQYVASYLAPVGRYSANSNYFTAGVTNNPLYAFGSAESGGNGVYLYGSGGFPTNTFQATNYWVDVAFTTNIGPDTSPPTVSSTVPTSNATGVGPANPITVTFNESMDSLTINDSTVELRNPTNTKIAATVTYNAGTNTATLSPTNPLAVSTQYTGKVFGGVSGVKDIAGNALAADFTWQFTTGVDPCSIGGNPIVCENSKLGNPSSEWDVNGAGDPSIQGFATDISVNKGGTVSFKVDANNPSTANYRLDIYRLGYYNGNGARLVATVLPTSTTAQTQPACLNHAATGLIDCGNWANSASWPVPANAVSGIYFAKAVRQDGVNTGKSSHIVFIVRDDSSTSDILFQTADTTWQAYNNYGGNNLYGGTGPGTGGNSTGRAYKVSYNRPFSTRNVDNGQDWLFNAEYPMVRWLEANGYNVSYFTGVDSDRFGSLIRNHKLFMSNAHDEYWSNAQRVNVEAARDAGTNPVNLAFFSGNEVFWKTRWENNIVNTSGSLGTSSYRTLVCYKETHNFPNNQDPTTSWTGTWRDPRGTPPADGGRPENALLGPIFMVNDGATTSIQVPEPDGKLRFWRDTSVASLAPNTTATLPNGTLGYEWDVDLDNGFRPEGLVRLSTTIVNNAPILTDNGSTFGSGTANHALTLYKASSGALVFGAGTVQWAWGLDSNHDRTVVPTNAAMQQATVNLFADMGIQPATIQLGLTVATASTDTIRPTTAITSPATGATVTPGSLVTISGTSTDSGGRVGAVEVSVDGGLSWHPATGRGNWSYDWTAPTTNGTASIMSRAVDDSLNIQTTPTAINVIIGTGSGGTPPTAISDRFLFRASILRTINNTGSLGLGVLANDTESGNLPLSAQAVGSLPTGATLAANGVVTVNRTTNASFNYRANNGSLLSLPTTGAGVNLTLDTVPIAVGENCTYNRAGSGTIVTGSACTMTGTRQFSMNLTGNDTDSNSTTNVPTDGVGDAVTGAIISATGTGVAVAANASCGQAAIVKTASRATITNNCDGTLTIVVPVAAPASPISLNYRALDDLGAQSATRNDVVTVQ